MVLSSLSFSWWFARRWEGCSGLGCSGAAPSTGRLAKLHFLFFCTKLHFSQLWLGEGDVGLPVLLGRGWDVGLGTCGTAQGGCRDGQGVVAAS